MKTMLAFASILLILAQCMEQKNKSDLNNKLISIAQLNPIDYQNLEDIVLNSIPNPTFRNNTERDMVG